MRHKIPFFLIPLFLASALLATRSLLYASAFAGQLLVYALAVAGWALRNRRIGRAKLLFVPYYFCFVNVAAFLGLLSILRGNRVTSWAPRGGDAIPSAPESSDPAPRSIR